MASEVCVVRTVGVFVAAIAMLVSGPGALASEPSKNLAPDFTQLPEHSKILVAPPDVELFEISAGGVPAPRADWSAAAQQFIHAEIERRRAGLGVDTLELDETTADEFGELLSLHAAVAESIALHHFGGVPLPTKNGRLDWSFADAFKPLEERTDARYGLFIWVRDGYASASRQATIAITAILTLGGVIPSAGLQSAYASLVDLDSGRVLWFNWLARSHGDLREAESATETVDALLKSFPTDKAGASE